MSNADLLELSNAGLEQDLRQVETLLFDETLFAEEVERLAELDDANRPLVETLNSRAETKRYSANDSANQRLINL